MFFSTTLLIRSKGPLSKIWIAAHFQKKLTKAQVTSTDITRSCKSIEDPTTPLALRISGQLLLGLVRIYYKKVAYLLEDCTDAMTKVKLTFRVKSVDLPESQAIASKNLISLPDMSIEQIELAMPDISNDSILVDPSVSHHAVVRADITLRDDELNLEMPLMLEDVPLDESFYTLSPDAQAKMAEIEEEPEIERKRRSTPAKRTRSRSGAAVEEEDESLLLPPVEMARERDLDLPSIAPMDIEGDQPSVVEAERSKLEQLRDESISGKVKKRRQEMERLQKEKEEEENKIEADIDKLLAQERAKVKVGEDEVKMEIREEKEEKKVEAEGVLPLIEPVRVGVEEEEKAEEEQKKEREKKPPRKRRRRVHFIQTDKTVELTTREIQAALTDTSDIVRQRKPMSFAPPAQILHANRMEEYLEELSMSYSAASGGIQSPLGSIGVSSLLNDTFRNIARESVPIDKEFEARQEQRRERVRKELEEKRRSEFERKQNEIHQEAAKRKAELTTRLEAKRKQLEEEEKEEEQKEEVAKAPSMMEDELPSLVESSSMVEAPSLVEGAAIVGLDAWEKATDLQLPVEEEEHAREAEEAEKKREEEKKEKAKLLREEKQKKEEERKKKKKKEKKKEEEEPVEEKKRVEVEEDEEAEKARREREEEKKRLDISQLFGPEVADGIEAGEEEKVEIQRTKKMHALLDNKFTELKDDDRLSEGVSFNNLANQHVPLSVANLFYQVLVLKTNGLIDAKQDKPYGDVRIFPTKEFEKPL